jgi:hypothetical protein
MNFKTLIWSAIFAISMGFFESSVVIYLREIAYPNGFCFPIQTLKNPLLLVEIFREIFSLIMLVSVSFLIGKRGIEKLAWFLYNFAIWDIFYYVFLKIFIGWPDSFLTMDLLFMLPVVWKGPVLAPLIASVVMILLSVVLLNFSAKIRYLHFKFKELLFLILGSIFIFVSFTIDQFIYGSETNITNTESSIGNYSSEKYYWPIFGIGIMLIIYSIFLFIKRNKRIRAK